MKNIQKKNILAAQESLQSNLVFEHSYSMFKVGDIVNERHFPKRIGVILEVNRREVLVHWQRPNPNSRNYFFGAHLELLDKQFIELTKGEEVFSDI